eukprot:s1047_g8.t1
MAKMTDVELMEKYGSGDNARLGMCDVTCGARLHSSMIPAVAVAPSNGSTPNEVSASSSPKGRTISSITPTSNPVASVPSLTTKRWSSTSARETRARSSARTSPARAGLQLKEAAASDKSEVSELTQRALSFLWRGSFSRAYL